MCGVNRAPVTSGSGNFGIRQHCLYLGFTDVTLTHSLSCMIPVRQIHLAPSSLPPLISLAVRFPYLIGKAEQRVNSNAMVVVNVFNPTTNISLLPGTIARSAL